MGLPMTTQTDRELLELAAKAIGHKTHFNKVDACQLSTDGTEEGYIQFWNPLTDDGDALRLAVKLSIRIYIYDAPDAFSFCATDATSSHQNHGSDPCAATRRAIVRAAAEIGKAMQ